LGWRFRTITTINHLPTGGWGWSWVGDPDLGFGINQPGGWVFNILPYCEGKTIYDIGGDARTAEAGPAYADGGADQVFQLSFATSGGGLSDSHR
jgi:hypothetical protein